jgi:hypothetical protein
VQGRRGQEEKNGEGIFRYRDDRTSRKKTIDDQWEEISLVSVCSHWVSLIYPESKRERKESIFCSFLSVDALLFSSALYTVRRFS